MQNYRLERKATLWWALERTTQKRDSGMILTDYPEIMKEIRESDTLRKLWEKHSREFEYAKDISFDDTCNTIQTVMALTRRYAAIVTMRRRHRHHETSGQLRGAELRRADRSLRQPGHDGCLHLHQQGRQTRGRGRRARDVLSARAAFPRQRRPSVVYRNRRSEEDGLQVPGPFSPALFIPTEASVEGAEPSCRRVGIRQPARQALSFGPRAVRAVGPYHPRERKIRVVPARQEPARHPASFGFPAHGPRGLRGYAAGGPQAPALVLPCPLPQPTRALHLHCAQALGVRKHRACGGGNAPQHSELPPRQPRGIPHKEKSSG